MPARLRVLVVDDSAVMRRIISEALGTDEAFEVVGVAANGEIALQRITQLTPDAVTLDVEMPVLDGLATIRRIRETHPTLPVIMCSSLTHAGAEATLDALAAGANDWLAKPARSTSLDESVGRIAVELLPKLRALCKVSRGAKAAAPVATRSAPGALQGVRPRVAPDVVCIATSTGGPNALAELFTGLPDALPVPIVLVQHMPPLFTRSLAERLGRDSVHRFFEATDGQVIEPGCVYIAPGGRHMEVERVGVQVRARLHDGPAEQSCRPAADVLFRSVAEVYGRGTLACVLTGMGQDGLRGCEAIRSRGGEVIAQDEASSVVWGMPGAVVNAGLALTVRPLSGMADEIRARVTRLVARAG